MAQPKKSTGKRVRGGRRRVEGSYQEGSVESIGATVRETRDDRDRGDRPGQGSPAPGRGRARPPRDAFISAEVARRDPRGRRVRS